jgi:drug/metabolite transporter (DMT)-like permease
MNGVVLTLLASLSNSITDILRKQLTQFHLHPIEIVAYRGIITVPFMYLLTFLDDENLVANDETSSSIMTSYFAMIASSVINFVTSIMMFYALNYAPLSITTPFLSITPIFLLLTGYLILGEKPVLMESVGVIIVGIASYLLLIDEDRTSSSNMKKTEEENTETTVNLEFLSDSVRRIHRKGMLLMIGVAVLWSLSSIFDKIGTRGLGEQKYGFYVQLFITIPALIYSFYFIPVRKAFSPTSSNTEEFYDIPVISTSSFSLQNSKSGLHKIIAIFSGTKVTIMFVLCAVVGSFSYYVQLQALSIVNVSYVIAIKRAGCLITLALSKVIYPQEEAALTWRRVTIVTTMVVGVILVLYNQ